MTGSVHFTDLSASKALMEYAGLEALRGKTMLDTMKKIMGFWVDFATKKIKKGNPDKIYADMQEIVTNYSRLSSRRGKTADAWRGTYAAMLVAMLNWQGARNLKGAAFYAKARMFANRRRLAANLHRSGMRPAMMALRQRMSGIGKAAEIGKLPNFKTAPGGYIDSVKASVVDILVENWARAGSPKSVGITGLAPNAFGEALVQVEALLADYFKKDIMEGARRVGLTVDP